MAVSYPSIATSAIPFFYNASATTEFYTLSLHDALPISVALPQAKLPQVLLATVGQTPVAPSHRIWGLSDGATGVCPTVDRKSTRLNSSHSQISYAVFCLKKKKFVKET